MSQFEERVKTVIEPYIEYVESLLLPGGASSRQCDCDSIGQRVLANQQAIIAVCAPIITMLFGDPSPDHAEFDDEDETEDTWDDDERNRPEDAESLPKRILQGAGRGLRKLLSTPEGKRIINQVLKQVIKSLIQAKGGQTYELPDVDIPLEDLLKELQSLPSPGSNGASGTWDPLEDAMSALRSEAKIYAATLSDQISHCGVSSGCCPDVNHIPNVINRRLL